MSDLTWQELLGALPPGSIYLDQTRGVCLNVSLISGETPPITALTALGVVEFAYKFLDAANRAQITKNNALPPGSKLNAFGDPVWSTPSVTTSTVVARHSVSAVFTVFQGSATAPLR
jgi:hypothetical protein